MVKIRQYGVAIFLALSLLFNFVFLNQFNNMNSSLNFLRQQVIDQAVTIQVYDYDNKIIKELTFNIETQGLNLETHLINLKIKGLLDIGVESTPIGAWVSQVSSITPKENFYWSILSMTNPVCKLASSDPENYSGLDGYCTKGISEIMVEAGDVFVFRLIGY
jgi:hypothetical protein